jgi:4-alpha-glucanotransferase
LSSPDATLQELAELYGVQTSYEERPGGPEHNASAETLIAVLRALDAPVENRADVLSALRAKREEQRGRLLEPVSVVWGQDPSPTVSLAGGAARAECTLTLESGDTEQWRAALDRAGRIALPGPIPFGYHQLRVRTAAREATGWLFSAPERTWDPEAALAEPRRDVGLFLPLYALRTERSWGTGDLTDLGSLLDWAGRRGVRFVGTLPLLATFLGGGKAPLDPGPYGPVSRLFWNELYLDVERAPGLERSPGAQRLLGSAELRAQVARLRNERRVRYAESMALERRVLESLVHDLEEDGGLSGELAVFSEQRADALSYARFRAAMERHGPPTHRWPTDARAGRGEEPEHAVRYHLYAQWALDRQLRGLQGAGERGDAHDSWPPAPTRAELYLDLPLGTHPEGFDRWRFPDAFVDGVSVGAPPDPLQLAGQDWGFPPLHPKRTRESGHVYFRRSVANLMRVAGMLRLDHVMSLHRLFWIPSGAGPRDGAYVRYPAEELYAVLCIESHRWKCEVIGEDLGTVPPEVRESMRRHGIGGMYLLPFELEVPAPASAQPPHPPPPQPLSVVSLGTHDLPPFAAYASGLDLAPDETERIAERARWFQAVKEITGSNRDDGALQVLPRALRTLAGTAARHLLVNVEDLWGETESQNQPGTVTDANWSLRAQYPLEAWSSVPELEETISSVVEARRAEPIGTRAGGAG